MVCDIGSYPKPIVTELAPRPYTRAMDDLCLVGTSSGLMMVERRTKAGYIYEPTELFTRTQYLSAFSSLILVVEIGIRLKV
jgi:hypothetical protein